MWQTHSGTINSGILRLALAGSVFMLVGCAPSGTHAGQGADYTRQVMSLYDEPAVNHGQRNIEFPVKVAAAQIGDATPQPAILEKLRSAKPFFKVVESLPAQTPDSNEDKTHDSVRRLERMARDMGVDYLLVYAATVDTHVRPMPTAVVDLTIVGAFVPITRDVKAEARASAVLIDVRTGTVVLSAGAAGTSAAWGSDATADATADEQAEVAQNKSLDNLATEIIASAHRRAAEQTHVAGDPTDVQTHVAAQDK